MSATLKVPGDDKGAGAGAQDAAHGSLLLVGTPIGNQDDLAPRAVLALQQADLIAAEDTRRAGLLLAQHGIKTRLVVYHDHNEEAQTPVLLTQIQQGAHIALISDAGLPLISDPGYRLVQACITAGVPVSAVPGPNAALLALILSGLPGERFYFHGFLPSKAGARRAQLATLATLPATLIFYEAPHRIAETLADAHSVLGDRAAAVARELTKTYEEVRRGPLAELAAHYADTQALGEIVLVVAGHDAMAALDGAAVDDLLRAALTHMRVRDAAARWRRRPGRPASDLYARAFAAAGEGMSRADTSRRNHASGLSAERWAEWVLRLKGYRILKRRWRTPVGEIDLLAARGQALVLVEVKRRATIEGALACVSPHQQQRLRRALHYAVACLPAYAGHSWRCDLIALAPRRLPRHIVNAWEVG